jgi:hypothetical protein
MRELAMEDFFLASFTCARAKRVKATILPFKKRFNKKSRERQKASSRFSDPKSFLLEARGRPSRLNVRIHRAASAPGLGSRTLSLLVFFSWLQALTLCITPTRSTVRRRR